MSNPPQTEEATPVPVPSREPMTPVTPSRTVAAQPRSAAAEHGLGLARNPREVSMGSSPIVEDVMRTCLVTTGEDVRLSAATTLLRHHGISGVPVVSGTKLVGVLSEKDILRALAENAGLSVASEVLDDVLETPAKNRTARRAKWKEVLDHMRVGEVMTSPAITVTQDANLDAALRWMLLRHVHRLPVVDGPHLVGIITRGDVLSAMGGDR